VAAALFLLFCMIFIPVLLVGTWGSVNCWQQFNNASIGKICIKVC
jgi:hypothetical protein